MPVASNLGVPGVCACGPKCTQARAARGLHPLLTTEKNIAKRSKHSVRNTFENIGAHRKKCQQTCSTFFEPFLALGPVFQGRLRAMPRLRANFMKTAKWTDPMSKRQMRDAQFGFRKSGLSSNHQNHPITKREWFHQPSFTEMAENCHK